MKLRKPFSKRSNLVKYSKLQSKVSSIIPFLLPKEKSCFWFGSPTYLPLKYKVFSVTRKKFGFILSPKQENWSLFFFCFWGFSFSWILLVTNRRTTSRHFLSTGIWSSFLAFFICRIAWNLKGYQGQSFAFFFFFFSFPSRHDTQSLGSYVASSRSALNIIFQKSISLTSLTKCIFEAFNQLEVFLVSFHFHH